MNPLARLRPLDPYNIVTDDSMPGIRLALDPLEVQKQLDRNLPHYNEPSGSVHLHSIEVTRHKPGRRCVIEYGVTLAQSDQAPQAVTLIGKIRARHSQGDIYRLQDKLWQGGFDNNSNDGISIPQPACRIKDFRMWLQHKVAGNESWEYLSAPGGVKYARHIAAAAHKLHQLSPPTERSHSMADELRILHERLPAVVEQHEQWRERIQRVLRACNRLGTSLTKPQICGIHRDFYQDQVIIDDERLYLIDFDLYCHGDPALDIGNFIAHITEQSLRSLGDASALLPVEMAMEDHFAALAGEKTRLAVRTYTLLTLVRHIHLSTLFEDRHPYTEALLALCETRLDAMGQLH